MNKSDYSEENVRAIIDEITDSDIPANILTSNILCHWPRTKIIAFSKRFLGTICERCNIESCSDNPTLKEAIAGYMKEHGFTSIVNPAQVCGCGVDMMPCDTPDMDACQLGYTKKCNNQTCLNTECESHDNATNEVCFTLDKPSRQRTKD